MEKPKVETATTERPMMEAFEIPAADEVAGEKAMTLSMRRNYVDEITRLENGLEILKRMTEAYETLHRLAIRATNPTDWVLSKDRAGITTALLLDSGVHTVAKFYGVQIFNVRPLDERGFFRPERSVDDKGRVTMRAWCDCSARTGEHYENLSISRRSDEDFTGRGVDQGGGITTSSSKKVAAFEEDLKQCVYTGLRTKATKILADMAAVPPEVLDDAWQGIGWKKSASCRKGHGYGTGSERDADSVTSGDTKKLAIALGKEILSRVGGDRDAAANLLKEITEGKDFTGFTSVERMTKDWQIENAAKRLREHKVFGDKGSAMGNGGDREPGEGD